MGSLHPTGKSLRRAEPPTAGVKLVALEFNKESSLESFRGTRRGSVRLLPVRWPTGACTSLQGIS